MFCLFCESTLLNSIVVSTNVQEVPQTSEYAPKTANTNTIQRTSSLPLCSFLRWVCRSCFPGCLSGPSTPRRRRRCARLLDVSWLILIARRVHQVNTHDCFSLVWPAIAERLQVFFPRRLEAAEQIRRFLVDWVDEHGLCYAAASRLWHLQGSFARSRGSGGRNWRRRCRTWRSS